MTEEAQNAGLEAVILVAAGRGSRAGDGLPKQYRALGGMPVIRRTMLALAKALPDAKILPVIHADDEGLFAEAAKGIPNLLEPVEGGASRQESVLNGLVALTKLYPGHVYIHDAARPFVSKTLMHALQTALAKGHQGVVPVVPIVDTLVRKTSSGRKPVDRADLVAVQTPQAFDFMSIFDAHTNTLDTGYTDDASIFDAAGGDVVHVSGDERNFKITRPQDFEKADKMIEQQLRDIRVGSGYDVHRFEDGDHVWLCGVAIPHTQSLKGHSDADVGLHALTDAILAALADGDIGAHFPPTDEKWRGASSDKFLTFAAERVRARSGAINHLGVTLVCEAPKIRPHVTNMRKRIAEIVDIDAERVSVQATTTEQLGFTGRREGIAAQATATIALPTGQESI